MRTSLSFTANIPVLTLANSPINMKKDAKFLSTQIARRSTTPSKRPLKGTKTNIKVKNRGETRTVWSQFIAVHASAESSRFLPFSGRGVFYRYNLVYEFFLEPSDNLNNWIMRRLEYSCKYNAWGSSHLLIYSVSLPLFFL